VRFGLFYEHQLPRPWHEDSERRLIEEALDQVQLADSLGYDCAWAVEHHFLEEYSHSSAPEVFLAAASQRTKRIRLGHGVIQLPPGVNHPARIAERVATLDLVSGGRVELGTGEASSAAELGAFGIPRRRKREQWSDALDALTRMFVEVPFAGWDSEWVHMPPRNVVPKPLQKPHPPIWVACSRRETIHLAARHGLGALSFSFMEPEDAARWVGEYYEILSGDECRPAGFAVNPNVAVVLPMMCHADEQTALERGMPGAGFFGHSLAHYYGTSAHAPGRTDLAAAYSAHRAEPTVEAQDSRDPAPGTHTAEGTGGSPSRTEEPPGRAGRPLALRVVSEATGSRRGAIGTPAQVRELLERYETAGVDQVIFVMQAGANRHEHIQESLTLFAHEVMPAFHERRVERDGAKRRRLAPAVTAALARREPPRTAAVDYRIDERSELSGFVRAPRPAGPRPTLGHARRAVRRSARRGTTALVARALRGRNDEQLEHLLGSAAAQRALMSVIARRLDPRRAGGWQGQIVWELLSSSSAPQVWTLVVADGHARIERGRGADAMLLLRVPLAVLARAVSGELSAAELGMSREIGAEGDLGVLQRLGEMLGAPSPY
jgi:alkanesulfonate monooxygenase SsuD/methylene tetrahydromethanopterin reductase-like flavin-dependent oxidoreductase (luciferase family)